MWPFLEHKNLHFDNEIRNSYELQKYEMWLSSRFGSANYLVLIVFYILGEVD